MYLKETRNVWPVSLIPYKADRVFDALLGLRGNAHTVYLDQETAQQLLPILEYFIKTGELPDAS